MTRDRSRPAVLVRKVLLPSVLSGAIIACLLAALVAALVAARADGSRADADNSLAGGAGHGADHRPHHGQLVIALSAYLEGRPVPRDVRRARRPLPERLRRLGRHPYVPLYTRAQRRFGVPWVLVAAVHYQETGFARRGDQARRVFAIAAQLRAGRASKSLGDDAARALSRRYGASAAGRISTAMVLERARAWRLLGAIPARGGGELAMPVAGVVGGCGHFGCPRPGHLHNGVDFVARAGVPIHAADAGQVALVQAPGASGGYGSFVCLQHRPHLATCYAHLGAIGAGIAPGAHVRRGQAIGLVGSTGSSSVPHLHFEVRLGPAACQSCAVDPMALLSGDVPQSRVPRMLRASASADRAVAAARTAPPIAGAEVDASSREPGPALHAPVAPAPAPATPDRRRSAPPPAPAPTPDRRPSVPPPAPAPATGGASVAPPAAVTAAPTAPAAPARAAPEGGASPTADPAGATAKSKAIAPPPG